MIGQSKWTDFSLLKTGGATGSAGAGAGGGLGESGAAGTINTTPVTVSSFAGIRLQFDSATVEGNTLTLKLVALNQGLDRTLAIDYRNQGSSDEIFAVDNTGVTHQAAGSTIGNAIRRTELVNGVATPITVRFPNLPTQGGRVTFSSISKLTLNFHEPQRGQVEFRHLPLQAAVEEPKAAPSSASSGANAAPVNPPAAAAAARPDGPVVDASASDIDFHLQSAVAEGSTLVVTVTASNTKDDRMVSVVDGAPATVIDENGNTYTAESATVGNRPGRAELLNRVATKITLKFAGVPTTRGVTTIQEVKRLRMTVTVQEAAKSQGGQIEFRNVRVTR